MGRHPQTYRQCADCYHWIGHSCQIRPQPPVRRSGGETLTCKAFIRGSLFNFFQDRDRRPFPATPW